MNHGKSGRQLLFATALSSAALMSSGLAFGAQPPAAPAATGQAAAGTTELEAVVVTAEKRSELLTNVPMSVSAATGQQLQRIGVANVADLSKISPGLTYQPGNYSTPIYFIRGVGFLDNTLASAPTVGLYVDQAPLPYSVLAEGAMLDLQRVEVLKGPQGTLFGQNATGGAINFIANKPTRTLQAGADLSYGNFDAVTVNGYVSGPLSDTLAARLALQMERRGGWQTSETRDAQAGQKNFYNGRALFDWNPRSDLRFELNLSGWIDKSDTQAAQFVAFRATKPPAAGGYTNLAAALTAYQPAPKNDRVADWWPGGALKRDDNFYMASLRGDWDLNSAATLTSITAYSGLKRHTPTDVDGTNLDNMYVVDVGAIHSISQELRLAGQVDEQRLKWMLGANYQYNATGEDRLAHYTGSNSGIGPNRYNNIDVKTDQNVRTVGVFGSLDYNLTPTLTASGSARYTNAVDDFHGCLRDVDGALAKAFSAFTPGHPIGAGQCVTLTHAPPAQAVPIVQATLNENNVSWRASLNWKPQAGSLVYANVTRGYKAGGFLNVPALVPQQVGPIKQESVLAYEVGAKQALLGNSMQVNAAVFYYDYSDKQLLGYIATALGNLPGLVSVPKSHVEGVEANVIWKPIARLNISLGGTYVDSHVDSTFVTTDPFGASINIHGSQFPSTPKWQLTGDVQYNFDLMDNLTAYVGADARYHSQSAAAFGGGAFFTLPSYGLLDLRAGVESPDNKWRVELWGRNVTNQFYVVNVNHVIDTVARMTGMPATYGVTFGYRFR